MNVGAIDKVEAGGLPRMARFENVTLSDFGPAEIIWVLGGALGVVLLMMAKWLLGVRWIPNRRVGVIEKLWSLSGSLREGHLVAIDDRAGFQAEILRGGVHFFYWPWQYRITSAPLVLVPQGSLGYVFARDGEALAMDQCLGRVVDCHDFRDAEAFLLGEPGREGTAGQAGRQRGVLREGTYAINLALFSVITRDRVYRLRDGGADERVLEDWRRELESHEGFSPVVIEGGRKRFGRVTVHDGPVAGSGAPEGSWYETGSVDPGQHAGFQDIAAFLRAGGRRGLQDARLGAGTYFINRWFAMVEIVEEPATTVMLPVSARVSPRARLRRERLRSPRRIEPGGGRDRESVNASSAGGQGGGLFDSVIEILTGERFGIPQLAPLSPVLEVEVNREPNMN